MGEIRRLLFPLEQVKAVSDGATDKERCLIMEGIFR